MEDCVNFNAESYTEQAKTIVSTYNTISDRLYVAHSCEINSKGDLILKQYGLSTGYTRNLFLVCGKEDSEENIKYSLHVFSYIDGKYEYVKSIDSLIEYIKMVKNLGSTIKFNYE